ncbi:MAG TPA: hypothetical protein VJB35_05610 [Candidatus Nanoarchaeia archaeon]|nr:hypothetical protein [Candidatus Nanoarchaeia archaeon]
MVRVVNSINYFMNPFDNLSNSKKNLRNLIFEEIDNGCLKSISENYVFPEKGFIVSSLNKKWKLVLDILDYELNGKIILDLGCGCNRGNIESSRYPNEYEPWFSRFAYGTRDKTGLKIYGVDVGNLSGESFPFLQVNLLKKNCLIDYFSENYFDLALAFKLFNSPELEFRVTGNNCLNATRNSAEKLKENLLFQLEQIVKPNGIFCYIGGDLRL